MSKEKKKEVIITGLHAMCSFSHYGKPRTSHGQEPASEGSFTFKQSNPKHVESLERLRKILLDTFAEEIKHNRSMYGTPVYYGDTAAKYTRLLENGYKLLRPQAFSKLREVLPEEENKDENGDFKFGEYNEKGDTQLRLVTNLPDSKFSPVPIRALNKRGGYSDLRLIHANAIVRPDDSHPLDDDLSFGEVMLSVKAQTTFKNNKVNIGLFPELIVLMKKSNKGGKYAKIKALENDLECIGSFIDMSSDKLKKFVETKEGTVAKENEYYYAVYSYYYLSALDEHLVTNSLSEDELSDDGQTEIALKAIEKTKELCSFKEDGESKVSFLDSLGSLLYVTFAEEQEESKEDGSEDEIPL